MVARPRLVSETDRPSPGARGSWRYDRAVQQHYDISKLRTGERVISEHVPSVRSVSLGFWIGAGSRDETPSRAGVSHFIEHLLFKGTERFGAVEIAERFDAMGGEINAATSRETTVVYTRVPDDHLDVALEIMAEMVFVPLLRDVDSEREVVLEEIAMVEDTPQELVHDLAAEAVFGAHPLGRPVIGRADVIASVSRRSLLGYHAAAYRGRNVILAAAGNLDHDRLVEAIARRPNGRDAAAGLPRRAASSRARPGVCFQEKDTEQYHVCLAAPGLARDDPRRYAAALLDAILGGSASSRLFQEIREKRGMAYSVYTYGAQYADTGQVGLYVGTREENLGECLDVVAAELRDLGAGNIRPGELERAKENMKGRLLLSLESTSARMNRLGKAIVTETEIVSVEETERRIEAVEPADVAALASELFAPALLSAAGIGPSEDRFREALGRLEQSGARAA